MTGDSEFEFGTYVLPAEASTELSSASAATADQADTAGTDAGSGQSVATETGLVAALQETVDAESEPANPPFNEPLVLLGAALSTYDVWSLSALLECAAADPDPPAHVAAVLPLARRFVACDES